MRWHMTDRLGGFNDLLSGQKLELSWLLALDLGGFTKYRLVQLALRILSKSCFVQQASALDHRGCDQLQERGLFQKDTQMR